MPQFKRSRRRFSFVSAMLASMTFSVAAFAQSGVDIRINDGLLTVQGNNISAGELAAELSRELGISVVINGDAETRVNLDIVEEPLEKALAKLSPNNLLVHDSRDEQIIEVVLMLGDSQPRSGGAEQFLPSGSPAEGIVSEEALQQEQERADPAAIRDPNRSAQARGVAGAASSDANLPPAQVPPMLADDVQNGVAIDPATGLPLGQ